MPEANVSWTPTSRVVAVSAAKNRMRSSSNPNRILSAMIRQATAVVKGMPDQASLCMGARNAESEIRRFFDADQAYAFLGPVFVFVLDGEGEE